MIQSERLLVKVASLLLLASLVAGNLQSDQVRHLIVNDANLIETQQGYAMMSPMLAASNWKTVSVNGDRVQVVAPNCQQTVLSLRDLANMPGQQAVLDRSRQMLYTAESNQPQTSPQTNIYRSGSARYSLSGNSATVSFARNIGMSSFQSNGLSMTKYDEHNMSISKSTGMPNNIRRIFITGDVVTFVYNDGRLEMKPTNCLQADEQQLVRRLREEVQQAHGQFQNNMNQFHQNMQNMNTHLHQNMQQMNQNLNNMFSRNFPFNSNFQPNNNYNNFNQNYQGQQFYRQPMQPMQPMFQQQTFGFPGMQSQLAGNNFMQNMPSMSNFVPGFNSMSAFSRAGSGLNPNLQFNARVGNPQWPFNG